MSASDTRCEELKQALAEARARLEPAGTGSAVPTGVAPQALDVGGTTPQGTDALREEIRTLERAIRDAGCDEPT